MLGLVIGSGFNVNPLNWPNIFFPMELSTPFGTFSSDVFSSSCGGAEGFTAGGAGGGRSAGGLRRRDILNLWENVKIN